MKTILLTALLPLLSLSHAHGQAPAITDAPKAIQELAAEIQQKPNAEIEKAIIKRFGEDRRNIGSGLRIEKWTVEGGNLTLHPFQGAIFKDSKTKKVFRLLKTHNSAVANLLEGYEMTTVPDPANHGNCTWLGNLKFGADSAYEFKDCGQPGNLREAEPGIFFMKHPKGRVEVRYQAPTTAETSLETLPEGTTVAKLIFTSEDKAQTATFSIKSSEQGRTLCFSGDQRLPFAMDAGWKNWR